MVNCSYCKKELNREVFCSPSHRTMFNRDKGFKHKTATGLEIENRQKLDQTSFYPKKEGVPASKVWKTADEVKKVYNYPGKLCPKHHVSPMGHGWHGKEVK